jgi:arginyl-tRNA synthetase
MITTQQELCQKFFHAIRTAYPNAAVTLDQIEITLSTQEKFGHYQCNSAMKLVSQLKANPRAIAEQIVNHIDLAFDANIAMISSCEIAGPGFINITLTNNYLSQRVNHMLQSPDLGIAKAHPPQKIIIDFSSPNIAKEMHVGHLRSTIIGDCLSRLFEFLGHNVLRLNHIGDWGTSFGMLIAHMKDVAADILTANAPTDLSHLVAWYRAAKQRFDGDEDFKKRAQMEVVALQGGNLQSLRAWEIICEISREAYAEIYDLLDVEIIARGESFYNPFLAEVVAELETMGITTISNGATCIFMEDFTNREGELLPLIIRKSDGGYNYDTTDLAAIRHRILIEKADRIIYETDSGQGMHFQMIFKAAELAGYLNPQLVTVDHVGHGLVLGADGKKFKTRSGDTERLIELLLTGIARAQEILAEKDADLTPAELVSTAKILGINAIKYADLSCNRVSDYTFSYERMLRFEGNTAAFLMYSYVRVNGIKRKVALDILDLMATTQIALMQPAEIALGLHLDQFPEVLLQVARDLFPHRLTEYLYGLAERFNAFFRDCRVDGDPNQNSRLLLCEVVAKVLHCGLTILGMRVVTKM